MIDSTISIIVGLICLTVIKIYILSIEKVKAETEKAKAITEMYRAESELRHNSSLSDE